MGDRFVDVAGIDEILEGCTKVFDVNGVPVALCRVGDEFYALEAVCTHDDFRLGDGPLENGEIECCRHGARFDVRTGEVRRMPAVVPLKTFLTRVELGRVWVCIEEEGSREDELTKDDR